MANVRKILVAVDFSENSRNALKYAYEFFKGCGVAFHVVHVVHDPLPEGSYIPHRSVDEMEKTAEEYAAEELQRFLPRRLVQSGEEVHPIVLKGEPYTTLVEYAVAQGLDIIVMGSQGATGLEKMLLGNVTDKVIRKSPVPVLVYKN